MLSQMVLSDFCMAPTDNAISISPNDVRDISTYYGTCNGTNPLYDPISSAFVAVNSLSVTVNTLTEPGGNCEGNEYLLSTYPYITNMYNNISFIEDSTDCPPLQHQWANIFNDGFCDHTIIALYVLFVTVCSVMVTLYALMVISSMISQYFDDYWETGNIVTQHGAAMIDANILDDVSQLQTDGSVKISSVSLDSSTPTVIYSDIHKTEHTQPSVIDSPIRCSDASSKGSVQSLHDDI